MARIKQLKVIKTEDDLDNLIVGGAFLGSGGGGPITAGLEMKADILKHDYAIPVVQAETLAQKTGEWGAIIAFMGSPEAGAHGIDLQTPTNAFNALEVIAPTGKMDFAMFIELGAGNSMVPLTVAARKKIAVVDGDGAGRAVPKIQCTTYDLNSKASPASLANGTEEGRPQIQNIIYLDPPTGMSLADELESYSLSILETPNFGSLGGLAAYQLKASEVQDAVVEHSLSYSYALGKAIREALASGASAIEAVDDFLDEVGIQHYTFGPGKAVEVMKPSESENGLDVGKVKIENKAGEVLTIAYENENLFATVADKPWAIAPDLICYLTDQGPLSNVEIQEGMEVTIVGIPADAKMREPVMVQRFEKVLAELGIQVQYVPIEKLHPKKD